MYVRTLLYSALLYAQLSQGLFIGYGADRNYQFGRQRERKGRRRGSACLVERGPRGGLKRTLYLLLLLLLLLHVELLLPLLIPATHYDAMFSFSLVPLLYLRIGWDGGSMVLPERQIQALD